MKKWIKPLLGIFLFIGFLALMKWLPFEDWLKPLFERLEEMGWVGGVLYAFIGILMTILFLPVSIPITLSGFFFGIGPGFLISSVLLLGGTSLGAIAGSWLWPKIKDKEMFQKPVFQAVREAIESDGPWMITLLRMTPFFHFMTGNIFLGSLDLNFFRYISFSYLGMIPGTLLLVTAGNLASQSMQSGEGLPIWKGVLFVVGLLAFSYASFRITTRTREKLDEKSDAGDDSA